jgi:HlyD family type I secretion membrane fusion protein
MMSVALRTPNLVGDVLPKKELVGTPKSQIQGFSPRPYIWAGYLVIFLAFGVFGTWSFIAPLASGVVATGTVSVESNRKTIQHLEGGIVSNILAKEGDIVEPGDVVLMLDPTQALGNYTYLMTRQALLEATEARLTAESTDASSVEYPPELKTSSDPVVKRAIALQQTIFNNRTHTRNGQISILNDRISQTQQAVEAMTQQIGAVDKQILSLNDEVKRLTEGQANGAVAINQLSQVTRAQLDMQGNHGQIEAQIAQLRQTISETKLQIASTNQQFVERAGGEMRDNSDQLNETTEKVRLAKDVLERTTVRAPVRGMLQNIRVHTKGGVIQPAQAVMDIIPLDDNLIITAKIQPIDIENVKVGMKAEVRFSSFSARTTPAMFGKITVLSQDVVEPTQANQAPYYEARIEVDDDSVPADVRGALLPGMPADVIVSTGERTFAQYVIKPLAETFHKSMREK